MQHTIIHIHTTTYVRVELTNQGTEIEGGKLLYHDGVGWLVTLKNLCILKKTSV